MLASLELMSAELVVLERVEDAMAVGFLRVSEVYQVFWTSQRQPIVSSPL